MVSGWLTLADFRAAQRPIALRVAKVGPRIAAPRRCGSESALLLRAVEHDPAARAEEAALGVHTGGDLLDVGDELTAQPRGVAFAGSPLLGRTLRGGRRNHRC